MTFVQYLAQRGALCALARQLGISHAAITQWRGRVPATRVADVEVITGIPRTVLRPDVFRRAKKRRNGK